MKNHFLSIKQICNWIVHAKMFSITHSSSAQLVNSPLTSIDNFSSKISIYHGSFRNKYHFCLALRCMKKKKWKTALCFNVSLRWWIKSKSNEMIEFFIIQMFTLSIFYCTLLFVLSVAPSRKTSCGVSCCDSNKKVINKHWEKQIL